MKNDKLILHIAVDAMIIALLAIMTNIPNIGYITVGPVSITTIHIAVLIFGFIFGWKQGLVAGTAFGILCLIKAATAPVGVMDPFFVNPMISLFPRMLLGLFGGILYSLIKKSKYSLGVKAIFHVLATILLCLFHSFTVLSMLFVFNQAYFMEGGQTYLAVISTIFVGNGLIELGSAVVLVPSVSLAVLKAIKPSFKERMDIYD